MQREIYEVYAKVVDANGTYNTLSGYPKVFDSRSYDNDIQKTYDRALAEYHTTLGAMYKADTRQLQLAMVIRVGDGEWLERVRIGKLADLPDPEPDPDPEPEPEE